MYKRTNVGWLKHFDFVLTDLICAELAFWAAYFLRHHLYIFKSDLYIEIAVLLAIVELVVGLFFGAYAGILRRNSTKEFMCAVVHVSEVSVALLLVLYLIKMAEPFSRATFLYMWALFLILDYPARLLVKQLAIHRMEKNPSRSVILLTTSTRAQEMVKQFKKNRKYGFRIAGLILYDRDGTGEIFESVPVVAGLKDAGEYICRNWIDDVFADLPEGIAFPGALFSACMSMGIPVHQRLAQENYFPGEQFVERFAGYNVITTAMKTVSWKQALCKRIMDIIGGLVGSAGTLVLTLILGPIIFIKSPGPIFFRQVRIGQNGRKFKIIKFRSMYLDAEERKKELEKQNKIKDGMMFKMDDDPRIIKGVGHFIRNHSLDEFPQFFNVLMGQMSLVGTRPPTVDEWEKYEFHHRIRMSAKPGITGMWQVNGRSEITDFEKVVQLDEEYIRNWSLLLDLKIIFKTVAVMFTKDGAS